MAINASSTEKNEKINKIKKNKNEGEKKKKLSTINFQKIRNKIRNYEKFN